MRGGLRYCVCDPLQVSVLSEILVQPEPPTYNDDAAAAAAAALWVFSFFFFFFFLFLFLFSSSSPSLFPFRTRERGRGIFKVGEGHTRIQAPLLLLLHTGILPTGYTQVSLCECVYFFWEEFFYRNGASGGKPRLILPTY